MNISLFKCLVFLTLLLDLGTTKAAFADEPSIADDSSLANDANSTEIIEDSLFEHNFDMKGDYAEHLHRVKGMKVWDESNNGLLVRYWAPVRSGAVGEVVYRYRFSRPISEASIACNLLPHSADDEVRLEVSHDDETYHLICEDRQHPSTRPPYSLTRFDLTRYAAGHKQIFLRIRLKGTQLNTSIMSAQFLRTADGIALFNAPNVYDFQAIMD